MTRKEFLQFSAGLVVILLGFGNLIALINHFTKPEPPKSVAMNSDARHGFGSRKFGA